MNNSSTDFRPKSRYERAIVELYETSGKTISFSEYFDYFHLQCPEEAYYKICPKEYEEPIKSKHEVVRESEEVEESEEATIEQMEPLKKKRKRYYTKNSLYKSKNQRFYKVLRQMALDRDGNQCVECARKEYLEAHHVIERSAGGTDDISNLLTLCPICHAEQHKGQPVYRLMIKRARELFCDEL